MRLSWKKGLESSQPIIRAYSAPTGRPHAMEAMVLRQVAEVIW